MNPPSTSKKSNKRKATTEMHTEAAGKKRKESNECDELATFTEDTTAHTKKKKKKKKCKITVEMRTEAERERSIQTPKCNESETIEKDTANNKKKKKKKKKATLEEVTTTNLKEQTEEVPIKVELNVKKKKKKKAKRGKVVMNETEQTAEMTGIIETCEKTKKKKTKKKKKHNEAIEVITIEDTNPTAAELIHIDDDEDTLQSGEPEILIIDDEEQHAIDESMSASSSDSIDDDDMIEITDEEQENEEEENDNQQVITQLTATDMPYLYPGGEKQRSRMLNKISELVSKKENIPKREDVSTFTNRIGQYLKRFGPPKIHKFMKDSNNSNLIMYRILAKLWKKLFLN